MNMERNEDEKNTFTERFKTFYLQYAGELISFARKYTDAQTAEDIVHDIFFKIWEKKSTIIAEDNIKRYLMSMVQNACYDYLKHQQVKNTFLDKAILQLQLDEVKYYETSNEDLWSTDKLNAIYVAIEKLPAKCRNIFKKAYIGGQKHIDIAKDLNISIRTVDTHVSKALKLIRNELISLMIFLIFYI